MLICYLQLKMKSKTERTFLMYIIYEDKAFTTFVYSKPTFKGVYTHFDSFLSISLVPFTHLLIDASDYVPVGQLTEFLFLKQIFLKNGYPEIL